VERNSELTIGFSGDEINDKYYKLAQFLSKCLEGHGQNGCANDECKKCGEVCKYPITTFDISACNYDCGTSQPCKDGCSWYDDIFKTSKIISDESLAPTAEDYAEVAVTGRDYLNVNFTWNAISVNTLPTVYVLTFSVTSDLSNATDKVADMVESTASCY
jgi:hypothetical protein